MLHWYNFEWIVGHFILLFMGCDTASLNLSFQACTFPKANNPWWFCSEENFFKSVIISEPCHIGIHLKELCESFTMNTNIDRVRVIIQLLTKFSYELKIRVTKRIVWIYSFFHGFIDEMCTNAKVQHHQKFQVLSTTNMNNGHFVISENIKYHDTRMYWKITEGGILHLLSKIHKWPARLMNLCSY